jgi:hypothetical protein
MKLTILAIVILFGVSFYGSAMLSRRITTLEYTQAELQRRVDALAEASSLQTKAMLELEAAGEINSEAIIGLATGKPPKLIPHQNYGFEPFTAWPIKPRTEVH